MNFFQKFNSGGLRCFVPAVVGSVGFALLALWIYWPALHGGWLWDDREDLPDNLILRTIHPLRIIWSGRATYDYYPIKNTLQWLQWNLWGNATLGYHLTNLALHVISALLIWRLLRRLGLRSIWAWVGGLLFLVHPVVVGSVAWIAEFKDCLVLPPLLLAAGAYLDYSVDGRTRPLVICWLWFVVAMLCKSSVMMFPACLLLYGWWARLPLRRTFLSSLPFFAVSAACGWVAVKFQSQRSISTDGTGLGGAGFRLSLAAENLGFYFRQAVAPHNLSPLYVRWAVGAWWPWSPVVLVFALLIWKRASWGRTPLLGLGWFSLNLLPVLGFVAISYLRFTWVMDHLGYAALIGIVGLAAAALQWLATRGATWGRAVAATLAVIAAGTLALQSRAYTPAYAGEEAIWAYSVEHQPEQWMGRSNLGSVRINQGRLAEAEPLLREAIRLNPNAPDAHRNLGAVLDMTGRRAEALTEARRALELRPDYAIANADVGTYLAQQGKFAEALPYYQAAARVNAFDPDLINRLGFVLLNLNRRAEGTALFQKALALNPNFGPAELNWGIACMLAKQNAEALAHFEKAARLLPNNAGVQQQLTWARTHLSSH